jgi:hypothetical protein
MTDWLGLIFLFAVAVGAFFGLRALANPKPRTSDDFERGAAENTTMAGALLNALHDVTDPGAMRAKEVRMQMKDGTYRKKRREGKAGGSFETDQDSVDNGEETL